MLLSWRFAVSFQLSSSHNHPAINISDSNEAQTTEGKEAGNWYSGRGEFIEWQDAEDVVLCAIRTKGEGLCTLAHFLNGTSKKTSIAKEKKWEGEKEKAIARRIARINCCKTIWKFE